MDTTAKQMVEEIYKLHELENKLKELKRQEGKAWYMWKQQENKVNMLKEKIGLSPKIDLTINKPN